MTRSGTPPRYKLISHPAVGDDLQALAAYGPDVDAATRGVLAIGVRDEHAFYRMAPQRIAAREKGAPSESRRH